MRYENMPKGRNKDICARCGKRANFADRLKSDVQYDLLCLAETTSSGYMTHGNVKLCSKCMSELLMWLDADDFCSYGERNADSNTLNTLDALDDNSSEKPNNSTISKMEQVETMSCAECKHRPIGAEICEEPCHYEPQTDWHYDEQDATWYPYKHEDEPQQKSCATCKHALGNWDGESNNCGRRCGADHRFYEPKDEPQTDMAEDIVRSYGFKTESYRQAKAKTEPQTERSSE